MSTAEGPPPLRYLNVGALIGAAGGSPWQVNASLQSGEPAEIDGLAQAFHNAAACTRQSDDEFLAATLRFEASWNRDQGDHPINDSAEVQRATQRSSFLRTQMPSVATDLEGIAAALAEAQRFAAPLITNLNTQLQYIDALIGQALATNASQADIDQLQGDAQRLTTEILHEVQAIRDTYSQTLDETLTKLRGVDGYAPEILDGIDADGKPAVDDKTQAAADQYNQGQRAADQALVDSGGPQTQQTQDAAARLRDFATATDPNADPTARRLAGERLDDFNTATRQGPPSTPPAKDPILGTDPASRAWGRLDLQHKLEQGNPILGIPGKTPDQATAMLDDVEQKAKVLATERAVQGLERQGMSPNGAVMAVDHLSHGMSWGDLAKSNAQLAELGGTGTKGLADSLSIGQHNWVKLTDSDIGVLETVGKRLGRLGTVAEIAMAVNDVANGAPLWETAARTAGGIGGGWAGGAAMGAAGGMWIGPEGAFIGAILGAAGGGLLGDAGADRAYKWLFGE